jgi:hypothetical protein
MVKGNSKDKKKNGIWCFVLVVILGFVAVGLLIPILVYAVGIEEDVDELICLDDCHPPAVSVDCSDSNVCTVDLLDPITKSCSHPPAPVTTSCSTVCYNDTTVCVNGACTGAVCAGACVVDGDCPAINVNTGTIAGTCIGKACFYKKTKDFTTAYCSGAQAICNGFLADNGTYTGCLTTSSFCSYNSSTTTASIFCSYLFACVDVDST